MVVVLLYVREVLAMIWIDQFEADGKRLEGKMLIEIVMVEVGRLEEEVEMVR